MIDTTLGLAVIMGCRVLSNKWADSQWEAVGVVPDRAGEPRQPRLLREDARGSDWLFGGMQLRLYSDEAENYLLNVTAPEPRVFVMWRLEEELARPALLTVSYGEAARMMDADERVDGVPMPADILAWVSEFARQHYRPPEKGKGGRFASQRREGSARGR
jgi:hypothetical protein